MLSRQSVLTTTVLITLVGLTNYFALKNVESKFHATPIGTHIAGIGENVQVTQMQPNGTIDYTATANKVVRYSDGKDRLFQIQATSYGKNPMSPWHLSANNGWSYANNSELYLWDQVHIWKNPAQNINTAAYPIDFKTSILTYYPAQDFATTDQLVTFTEPNTPNITTGIGMRAHPKADTLQLLSKVNSTYEPPTQPSHALTHQPNP